MLFLPLVFSYYLGEKTKISKTMKVPKKVSNATNMSIKRLKPLESDSSLNYPATFFWLVNFF